MGNIQDKRKDSRLPAQVTCLFLEWLNMPDEICLYVPSERCMGNARTSTYKKTVTVHECFPEKDDNSRIRIFIMHLHNSSRTSVKFLFFRSTTAFEDDDVRVGAHRGLAQMQLGPQHAVRALHHGLLVRQVIIIVRLLEELGI